MSSRPYKVNTGPLIPQFGDAYPAGSLILADIKVLNGFWRRLLCRLFRRPITVECTFRYSRPNGTQDQPRTSDVES